MSKHNKANKSNYIQAGRLTPDDMAREMKKQAEVGSGRKDRVTAKARPQKGGAPGGTRPRSAPEE